MKQPPRFFIPNAFLNNTTTEELEKQDLIHALKVLRLKKGAPIYVIDPNNQNEYLAELVSELNGKVKLVSQTKGSATRHPGLDVSGASQGKNVVVGVLIFGLCKGDKNDLVVEKATELGAQEIIIFASEHSVVKLKEDETKRVKRWETIAQSAAKQCKRLNIPKVSLSSSLMSAVDYLRENFDLEANYLESLLLCCSLKPNIPMIRNLKQNPKLVHLLIGPEGDISSKEELLALSAGFQLVTLGSNVLRAETAAIAAMAQVNGLWS